MAKCSKDHSHSRFIASATVIERWVVDANGEFIEQASAPDDVEVINFPNLSDGWFCEDCGSPVIE